MARNEAAIRSLGLTSRGCEILDLLASGESNKDMARRLGISPNTVKTHAVRVYEKLGVQRRVVAVGDLKGADGAERQPLSPFDLQRDRFMFQAGPT